jgi:TonB family protein
MDRLQKKCLIASFGTHGFLVLLLMFGSAFFVAKKQDINIPAIRVVPGKLVDALVSGGGGSPQVPPSDEKIKGDTLVEQPAAPQPQPPTPVSTPPKPEPRATEAPKLALTPVTRKTQQKTASDKGLPELKLTPVSPQSAAKTTAKADARAEKQRSQIAEKLGNTVASLRSGFEQGTAVEVNGPGGEAFVNYAQWVKQVYQDAWIVTDDMDDERATAKVSVTIARKGDVISAKIVRKSGNAVLDESVARTLAKVRFVAPFPEGAKDSERTFIINFNLKAKRAIG